METFTMFWGGPFSQWEPSTFRVEGHDYNCAEQFMMAEKARLFGDSMILARIMKTDNARLQKCLGRVVEDFDQSIWTEVEANGKPRCWNIVHRASVAKFSQNEGLRDALLATRGTTLVEASPWDEIWGIGLAEDNPDARDRSKWTGLNWLGEVLTDVRDTLDVGGGP